MDQLSSPIRLLAFCGSLRKQSFNRMALEALKLRAQSLFQNELEIYIFDELGQLPFFNPDLELALESEDFKPLKTDEKSLAALAHLKCAMAQADGLIIASPEYAHGVTGVIKNMLDWLVSGESFVDMPLMLINTSTRAHHAQDDLTEIVTTMSGRVIQEASLCLPLLGSQIRSTADLITSDLVGQLDNKLSLYTKALNRSVLNDFSAAYAMQQE